MANVGVFCALKCNVKAILNNYYGLFVSNRDQKLMQGDQKKLII